MNILRIIPIVLIFANAHTIFGMSSHYQRVRQVFASQANKTKSIMIVSACGGITAAALVRAGIPVKLSQKNRERKVQSQSAIYNPNDIYKQPVSQR